MTTFILTLLLTFFFVLLAMVFFWRFGVPVYRVEKQNIISLLELILSGQATEADWEVFSAYPIRHNDELGRVQQHCITIAEREYLGGQGMLFTQQGLEELSDVLQALKADNQKNDLQA